MRRKIMGVNDLEDIVRRMNGCLGLMYVLAESAAQCVVPGDAVCGLADLLEAVRDSFRASINAAEDYPEGEL